jgi:hypothetical protein
MHDNNEGARIRTSRLVSWALFQMTKPKLWAPPMEVREERSESDVTRGQLRRRKKPEMLLTPTRKESDDSAEP